jgi:hypothetical protein
MIDNKGPGEHRIIANTYDAVESVIPDSTVTIEEYHWLGGLPINVEMTHPQREISTFDLQSNVVQLRPRQQ